MLLSLLQATRNSHNKVFTAFRHLGAVGLFSWRFWTAPPLPTSDGPDILIVILVVSHRNPWYEYATAATAGAVVGACLTFRLARRAGQAYLDGKFGGHRIPKLLKMSDQWGMGVVVASCAIPFPLPTSLFFAAAGASGRYHGPKFLSAVTLACGFRYTYVALITHVYGRHVIRVLRHPTQYWGWLLLIGRYFRSADRRRSPDQ